MRSCPVDSRPLQHLDRFGVALDYCPGCGGVWLDRGELEKIVEAATYANRPAAPEPLSDFRAPAPPPSFDRPVAYDRYEKERRYDRDRDDDDYRYKKKKKSGFLGELFDFD